MTTTPTAAARVSGTIKALEWKAHNDKYDGGRTHYGTGVFGHWYAISRARNREWMTVHHVGGKPHHLPPVASLEAAKSAAQADYEARILAAIQPDPEPVTSETPTLYPSDVNMGISRISRISPAETASSATTSSAGMVSVEAAAKVLLGSMMAEHERPGDNARWHNVWREMERAQGYAWNRMEAALRALAGEGER